MALSLRIYRLHFIQFAFVFFVIQLFHRSTLALKVAYGWVCWWQIFLTRFKCLTGKYVFILVVILLASFHIIGNLSNWDNHYVKIQTQNHEMCAVPGPHNTIWGFFFTQLYLYFMFKRKSQMMTDFLQIWYTHYFL